MFSFMDPKITIAVKLDSLELKKDSVDLVRHKICISQNEHSSK